MNVNAIDVLDLSFKYNKTNVLQNIYMSVPKGRIYALLGPSGSGKTTLLRLILGRIRPNSGSITVFGNNTPGHFNRITGYMPQSQALSPELTIGETMNYFASIYQLPQKKFTQTKEVLKRVLCLANDDQVVVTLSGGQQKALSLALVFLHSPKLVILDEPTVGTDPILGDQIWSYLKGNCCQGLTVIIVTHYIQEASLADHVGMMRGGRMIEEGTPQMLYCKYDDSNLENIFIKICTEKKPTTKEINQRMQSYQKNIVNFLSYETNADLVYKKKNSAQMELDRNQIIVSQYSILWLLFILIRRNIQKFLTSKLTTVMLFSPMFCTLLMCLSFKVDKITLSTAVFNQDIERTYSEQLQAKTTNFSVHFIEYLQYDSLDSAINAVKDGQVVAAIWFEPGFSTELTKRALASFHRQEGEEEEEYDSSEIFQNEPIDKSDTFTSDSSESSTVTSTTDSNLSTSPVTLVTDQFESTSDLSIVNENETTSTITFASVSASEGITEASENMFTDFSANTMASTNFSDSNPSNMTRRKREFETEDEEFYDENYAQLSNETMRASTIKVYVDNSNIFFTQPLIDMLNYGSWELTNQVVKDHGHVTLASPVHIQEIVYAEGTDTPDFLLSGYMVAFLYLSQVTLASQLLIMERNDGFFDRAIVAGAKHSLMFFSHFITNFIFSFFQIGLMFFIGFVLYKIPNFGSHWLAFVLVVLQSASSIMTGLLISAICRENFSAFFIALSITLSQLFTSGAVFPIISFDPLIKIILNLTPISMPVESLRNVMLRGWSLHHFHVAHGFVANIVTTIAFGALALFFFIRRS